MQSSKQLVLAFIFSFASFTALVGQTTLEKVKVTKDISLEIPTEFTPMTQAEIYAKYVSSRPPIAMYSDPNRQVDLGVNENSSKWAGDDLAILKDFYKANIANLFTKVDFLQEEIKEINGREFIVFEFVSSITDEEATFGPKTTAKYNYMTYTLKDENILLFNFSCPARYQNQWKETAGRIMESVEVK